MKFISKVSFHKKSTDNNANLETSITNASIFLMHIYMVLSVSLYRTKLLVFSIQFHLKHNLAFNMTENTTDNLMNVLNLTKESSPNVYMNDYQRKKGIFGALAAIYVCIGIIAAIGNGSVLYASLCNRNVGRLRYFDTAIKSLALADMLFGLIGVPSRIAAAYYYLGIHQSFLSSFYYWKYIDNNIVHINN